MAKNDRVERRGPSDNPTPPVSFDEAAADFGVSPKALNAIKQLAWAGGELVDDTTAGFFAGLVDGYLLLKMQARLPVKKLIIFSVSILVIVLLIWTTIYPWLSHIQIHIT